MRKFKAAVVGCGRIGCNFDKDPKRKYISTHIGAYINFPETQLVAVCDKNKRNLEECTRYWNIEKGYTDVKSMLKNEKIDILSICTPPQTHYSILKEAVNFPLKAIFCEKPISDNIKEAYKMVELCKERGVILQINHQRRFDPLHIKLKQLIKDKKYGKVQQINFYYTAGIKNTGSHMFDLLRYLFGEVEWIIGFFSKNKSAKKNDPNIDGLLQFKDKVLCTFKSCSVQNYLIFELDCLLERARFVLKNSGFKLDFFIIKNSKYFSGYKELFPARAPFSTEYKRNFMIEAVKFLVNCIKYKKESISKGEDGLKALELIEASIKSAERGGERIYLS